jgi:trigger factor
VKVSTEKTENRQAFIKIEVEPTEIEAGTEKAYLRLVKKVDVPGFRRGKAPRAIFERNYGKDRLFDEALDDIIPGVYKKAIDELKLDPIAQPHVDVETQNPLVLKATVPLKPVITVGDYHTIDIKPKEVEITEAMVDEVIERLRHQNAIWEPVDRPVAIGDMVTIDLESTAKGEAFINRKGLEYQLLDQDTGPIPGFAGQLVGLKKGEEKEWTHKFPDDYFRKELAGVEGTFKVKVIEVKQEILPEISDQFAAQINSECTTVAVLRQKVMEEMKERAEHDAEHEFEDKVIEAATAMSQLEYPPVVVEVEIDHLMERNIRYIQQTGQSIEHYLQTLGKTIDQMREELRPAAKKRVEESLVLGKIAELEKASVTPEEINAEIEIAVSNADNKEAMRQALSTENNRESIGNTLVTRKVIKILTDIAKAPKDKKEETPAS